MCYLVISQSLYFEYKQYLFPSLHCICFKGFILKIKLYTIYNLKSCHETEAIKIMTFTTQMECNTTHYSLQNIKIGYPVQKFKEQNSV